MQAIPEIRIRTGERPANPRGQFVLYWMSTARRLEWNFALDHAIARAGELELPLVIVEALPLEYRWANARRHRFLLDGMADNLEYARARRAPYYPFVERKPGQCDALLGLLAARAALIVSDEYPIDAPALIDAETAATLKAPTEWADSNGLIPLRAAPKAFSRAYSFRTWIHRVLHEHLLEAPTPHPLEGADRDPIRSLPAALLAEICRQWPAANAQELSREFALETRLPIAQRPAPTDEAGGFSSAHAALGRFLKSGLPHYERDRNHPDAHGASGLSPWLHFGHLSTHDIVHYLLDLEDWDPSRLGTHAPGQKGFWGLGAPAADFVDELITWREIGFNFCHHRADYDQFESLPDWARRTLNEHARDTRHEHYRFDELEQARTGDPIWNAAQAQLLEDGRMHNYLRMLWGKKILEWSASPKDALATMIELNNRYALDGCDPNSYSGIFWVLGRYDRAWGPERQIFGKIRYMSSQNARRKLRMKQYLERYSDQPRQDALL
ncbi:MAG: deoxyribodipyrimidine photolyase [Chrysiogenetes bacterium]|nr:deoxyribodipyrimidine photolyase [Chrysiogenetes bacterium]